MTVENADDGIIICNFETTNVNNKTKTKPHGQ